MGLKALMGTKIGMTQIFDEQGVVIPVTVVQLGPNYVVGKHEKKVTVGYREITRNVEKRLNKCQRGVFAKAGTKPFRFVQDLPAEEIDAIQPNQEFTVSMFSEGQIVDVIGTSKGKGFSGCMERHNFNGQPKTHGQSDRWRCTGSTGTGTNLSRTLKGKRLPGQLGNVRKTVKNVRIVKIDEKKNLMLIRGAIPGAASGLVIVRRIG
jgi:large subunit ribosomal protein L3